MHIARRKPSGTSMGGREAAYEEESKRRRTEDDHIPGIIGAHRMERSSDQEAEGEDMRCEDRRGTKRESGAELRGQLGRGEEGARKRQAVREAGAQ